MPKITRSRESHSCRTCRRRRVRCDKVHPSCSRCSASSLTCIYSDRNAPAPSLDNDVPQSAVVKVERPAQPASVEHGHLEVGQNGFSVHANSTFWGNSSSQLGGDLRRLLLSVSSARDSPTSTFDGVDRSDPKLGVFSRRPTFNKSDDFSQPCQLCGSRLSLTCLLAMLPEKEVCDHLCNLFHTAVYPLMPILDQPHFLAQYKNFWAENVDRNWHISGPGQVIRRDPTFVCLIFAMLFAATIIESSNFPSDEQEDVLSGDIYFATMASLNLTGFPRRATHNSLAAYLFVQLQLSREEEFLDSPAFISTSFRTALGMGLHRDGSAFGCSPVQIETRRKLWWHVIHLDTMVASSSGLPPLFINENISNTGMISIFKDMDEDHDPSDRPGAESIVDVRHFVAKARYNLTRELRRIICKHLECRLNTLPDVEEALSDLDELRKSVWSTIATLSQNNSSSMALTASISTPQSYASEDNQDLQALEQDWSLEEQAPSVQIFRLYASTLAHLMLHKAYIMLLYPAMKSQDRSIWASVRQTAIRHSHAYLRLFAQLCTNPQFANFSWMYPGTYQPLQPLSLILADLIEKPESEEVDTSIGLVDAMFALYQVGEGVTNPGTLPGPSSSRTRSNVRRRNLSPAGQEAWSFLVSARRKALLQLGQDPHVLLPVSVDWTTFSQQACVCGGIMAPQSNTTSALQLPSQQLQIQASEPPISELPAQGQEQQQQDFLSDTLLPQGMANQTIPNEFATDLTQWPDAMLPSGGMVFDWDQWDTVLGGAIGSLV